MNSIKYCAFLLIALCTSCVAVDILDCIASENTNYDYKVNLRGDGTNSGDATLYFSFVDNFTAISMQFVYLGTAWLAVALSSTGGMIGSEAIIGLPDEPVGMSNPGKYDLGAYSVSAITIKDNQSLMDSSILQDDSTTTMTFVKLLEEPDELMFDPLGVNTFLWAHGTSNTLGYHSNNRSPFQIDFTSCIA